MPTPAPPTRPLQFPRWFRRFSDPIVRELRVPILSGPNRGRWWSLASAGGGHASGRRARAQLRMLARLIRPGDVVWDVGAHHGFVSILAAACVGRAGAVHAFEPSARNRAMLERHVRWNAPASVTVHPYALSDYDGEASFGGRGTSRMFALGGGDERVAVRRAATLVAEGRCARPSFVKVDVEGAEASLLAGLLPVLPASARLVIAMHGAEQDARCVALLRDAGHHLEATADLRRNRAGVWDSDPDLVSIGPEGGDAEALASLVHDGDR